MLDVIDVVFKKLQSHYFLSLMRSLARLSVCRLTSLALSPMMGFLGDAADVGLGKCDFVTFIMEGFRLGD